MENEQNKANANPQEAGNATDTTNTSQTSSDTVREAPQESTQDYRSLIAISAYILFFIPLLTELRKDPLVTFHTSQGFVLFVANLAVFCLSVMPIVGMLTVFLYPVLLVLMIIGIVNAAQKKQKELPLIGHLGRNIRF